MSLRAVAQSELREQGGEVEFLAPRSAAMGLRSSDIDKALSQALGKAVRKKITLVEPAAAPQEPAQAAGPQPGDDETLKRALDHPEVQKFQELFPGSQVRGVRDLKE